MAHFVTAPELGDVFARFVARGCAPHRGDRSRTGNRVRARWRQWCIVRRPDAGVGDAGFVPSRYCCEPSATLRQTQRQRVESGLPAALATRVGWSSTARRTWAASRSPTRVIDACDFSFRQRGGPSVAEHVTVDAMGSFAIIERPAEPWLAGAVAQSNAAAVRARRRAIVPRCCGNCRRGSTPSSYVAARHGAVRDYGYPRAAYYPLSGVMAR